MPYSVILRLIVTHCESGPVIAKNQEQLRKEKAVFTIEDHPILRDDKACYASSSYAIELAKKHNSQLHVLHITTEKELAQFEAGPIQENVLPQKLVSITYGLAIKITQRSVTKLSATQPSNTLVIETLY